MTKKSHETPYRIIYTLCGAAAEKAAVPCETMLWGLSPVWAYLLGWMGDAFMWMSDAFMCQWMNHQWFSSCLSSIPRNSLFGGLRFCHHCSIDHNQYFHRSFSWYHWFFQPFVYRITSFKMADEISLNLAALRVLTFHKQVHRNYIIE